MKLLDFVNCYEDWQERITKAPYSCMVSHDGDYYLLKYSQIDSDFGEQMVGECRGSIIKFVDGMAQYVCRPFDKFYNYGEQYAAQLDWEHIIVTEKIDGSLMKVWWDGEWHLSTNGTIDAYKARLGAAGVKTFGDLFEMAIGGQTFEEFCSVLDPAYTHMFELVSPQSRVVIPYEEVALYYLGSRNTITGIYYTFDLDLRKPIMLDAHSLEEVVEFCRDLDWMHEGFVAFDGVNRVKIKSPAYVVAHHARSNGVITWRHLVGVVLNNEEEEFLCYCEEYRPQIARIHFEMEWMKETAQMAWKEMQGFDGTRAEYAEEVRHYDQKIWGYLFKCRDAGMDIYDEWFARLRVPQIVELLELEE